MTLPTSFPLTIAEVATELGLPLPLSLASYFVQALAGVTALPLSMSQLLGKTGRFDGNVTTAAELNFTILGPLSAAPFFGATLSQLVSFINHNPNPPTLSVEGVGVSGWAGNIKLLNNTTGFSAILPFLGNVSGLLVWQAADPNITFNMVIRSSQNDSFTILPSS
jgi:hypothetical protein